MTRYKFYFRHSFLFIKTIYFNKPISKEIFIDFVFRHFISEKDREHFETQEELTFEKALKIARLIAIPIKNEA